MNKSPCSSRCWPSGHAAGKRRPLLHGFCREVTVTLPRQRARGEIFKLSLMITVIRLASGGSESEYGARESVAGTSHCHGHGASHAG